MYILSHHIQIADSFYFTILTFSMHSLRLTNDNLYPYIWWRNSFFPCLFAWHDFSLK